MPGFDGAKYMVSPACLPPLPDRQPRVADIAFTPSEDPMKVESNGLWPRAVLIVCAIVLLPALAHAQAQIVGQVRDESGAILPGVTVEATSPAIIEKVRSVVTDDQ